VHKVQIDFRHVGREELLGRRADELTRTSSCALEFWPVLDPSFTDGSREVRLDAYRALRDDLLARLTRRFPPRGAPVVG
jgi:hypothetical protein